jgi:phage repressor protein C with HTH and peptisase S24 domain/DNA-binding Xre family transcriptional regulator
MTYDELQGVIKVNIRRIIADRFRNKKQFAQSVGIDKATIYQAVDVPSKKDFTLNHLNLISEALDIPVYDLLATEKLIPGTRVDEILEKSSTFKEEFRLVPEIEPVACGNLSNITADHIVGYRVFGRPYLRDTFKPFITRTLGDSMAPTIAEGDQVLFDRNPDKLIKPADTQIYLINTTPFGEELSLTIKRSIIKENDLWLFPDNKDYRPEVIEMAEKSSPLQYILGVAIWIGKELKK